MKKNLLGSMALWLFALAAGAAFAAGAEQATPPQPEKNPEKALAKIGEYEIKEKDVDQIISMLGQQAAMYDNDQGRKAILDELVGVRLFALSGAKQELDKTPEFDVIMENFRNQTLARLTIEKMLQDVVVTDEEGKKFYDENPGQFTTPDEIRASHILLSDDVVSKDKIQSIQDELKKGTSFDVLATGHSTDPSAAQNGGDLGFFGRGQMVPEFEEAAFALKEPGDISDPVKSPFGWHIIKLEEKRPSALLTYEEMAPQINQYLVNEKRGQKYQETLDALKKEYKVEIVGEPVSADRN